jgi:hypothetical protein
MLALTGLPVLSAVKMAPVSGVLVAATRRFDMRNGVAIAAATTNVKRILEAFLFLIVSPARRFNPAIGFEDQTSVSVRFVLYP